jgi:hypothetical protein
MEKNHVVKLAATDRLQLQSFLRAGQAPNAPADAGADSAQSG